MICVVTCGADFVPSRQAICHWRNHSCYFDGGSYRSQSCDSKFLACCKGCGALDTSVSLSVSAQCCQSVALSILVVVLFAELFRSIPLGLRDHNLASWQFLVLAVFLFE